MKILCIDSNSYLLLFSGSDIFLVKIGNLDRRHGPFESWRSYVAESGSKYEPRVTNAFLKFQDFPSDYAHFHRLILSTLELPRESAITIMMFEEYFGAIHALDHFRYAALKSIFEARGRPKQIERRKIYALCDWRLIERYFFNNSIGIVVDFSFKGI
jgi:hypothetical protein